MTAVRPPPRFPSRWLAGPGPAPDLLILILLAGLLFTLRWGGPSNLTDNDQERPASYVLDAVANGQWLVQRDWTGDLTSKPPAYTWLAAAFSRVAGRVSLFTLYLPCALALLASACLVFTECRRVMANHRVALLAGVFLLANPLSAKLVALARTDALFTGAVTLTAVLAFRAWQHGRGWIPAWLAASLATLTKGPLGILIGFAGLSAWLAERRRGAPSPFPRAHLAGIALLLAIAGGWFLLAWANVGDALVRKMLKAELVDHALGATRSLPGSGLPETTAYLLSRFLPWSALTLVGCVWAVRRPETDPEARRWQRFALGWLLLGLTALGLATHQRGDLVAPLLPPAAVLAALPTGHWLARWPLARLRVLAFLIGAILAIAFQIQHLWRPLPTFEESRGLAWLAQEFRERGGDPGAIGFVDVPYALQFHLQTMRLAVSPEAAANELVDGQRQWMAVRDRGPLEQALGEARTRLRTLAAWPTNGPPRFQIVFLTTRFGGFDSAGAARILTSR